ncbi:hypothetical protein GE09DRAFT_1151679 [Coniochaeta sp. 2T2.1]|nr:hypothetical protein GE09DRAFT_1151679 [Coniochaeta sp. 2T2.1]
MCGLVRAVLNRRTVVLGLVRGVLEIGRAVPGPRAPMCETGASGRAERLVEGSGAQAALFWTGRTVLGKVVRPGEALRLRAALCETGRAVSNRGEHPCEARARRVARWGVDGSGFQ